MSALSIFAVFYWDPVRHCFTIPFINHPIAWYGVCFAGGFMLAYFLTIAQLKSQIGKEAQQVADKLLLYVMVGAVVGARLGHILFYEMPYYSHHPYAIFRIWEGGLASHGGTIGVIGALWYFCRSLRPVYPQLDFVRMLDLLAVPAGLVACCIRIGNFVNQEILGTPTDLPWGVIFGHPADGSPVLPRHPVQLYEALIYFMTFSLLYGVWKKFSGKTKPGLLIGIMMIAIFGARFVFEAFKLPLSEVINENWLSMGQYLSLPFILAGFGFLFYSKRRFSSL